MESPWLTAPEACAYLRMECKSAVKILNRKVRANKIRAVKPKDGKVYLFKQEWLDEYQMGKS